MTYHTFKLCKSGGFEAVPKRSLGLDLLKFAGMFENVKVRTGVMLVVDIEGARASIYPSGRMLLHNCGEERAQEIAMRVFRMAEDAVKK